MGEPTTRVTPASRNGVRVLIWLLWLALLAAWTVALLAPPFEPKVGNVEMTVSMRFYATKGLHLSAYAFLALLACWLTASWRGRLALWVGLFAHAATTEYGQTFVPGRSGSVSDVGVNTLGILIGVGVGLAWQRWRAK